ncbi:MAG: tRNA dihydrouridine synthase DusB [Candidatus Eisenbacteria bacterium]|nr:tRNA dihydrouridine synthase DusB [Candidatus Eisenbacteria bacterium]
MFEVGTMRIERGIFLAPMEDVSEQPFRRLCRRFGADLVYTEFVSSEGLIREAARTQAKIVLAEDEHPVGIQLYGNRHAALVEATHLAVSQGPDLIDINFGCPVKKIACKSGAGSGLLREPELLLSLTRSVVEASPLPVTVKTRLGWDEKSIIIVDLARRLEDLGVKALTLHARTRSQMFKGEAAWEWIGKVKRAVSIPVIGNGDVKEPADVARMFAQTGCDAVMIGRAAIGNPWIFQRARALLQTGVDPGPPSLEARIEVYLGLLDEELARKDEPRAVREMRKHLSGYLRGAPNVSHLRAALMAEETRRGVVEKIEQFLEWRRRRPEEEWRAAAVQPTFEPTPAVEVPEAVS